MKQKFSLAFLLTISLLALASCSKKEEDMTPVQPGEMVLRKETSSIAGFKAPKAWVAESVPGTKTSYYSSPSTETRYQKFTEGDFGAHRSGSGKGHSTKELEAAAFKQRMDNITFSGQYTTTLGGMPAIKVSYAISGDEDGMTGYRIFTDKDSLVTYFDAATFGAKRMVKYAPIFDLSEKSVEPAFVLKITGGKIDSASMSAMMEQMKPSATFSTYQGSGYSIQYPDNFSASGRSGNGVEIKGERADAMVRVDANTVQKGIDLDKYVAENAQKTYNGATAQSTTLGGQAAKMISYGSGGASARAYFVMSGLTVYRITVSWPNELEAAFRPALEKSVQSFKAK